MKVFLFVLALALCGAGASYYAVNDAKKQARKTMEKLGFEQAVITQTKYQKGRAYHLDIILDKDEKLNTLDMLGTPVPLFGTFMGNTSNKQNMIGLSLTGRASKETGIDITAWSLTGMDITALPPLTIKKSGIDLLTPLGGLSFDVEADLSAYKGNKRDVLMNISTKQYELKFDTVWEGTIDKSGHWQYDITVHEAGFNAEKAQASRASGWMTLEKSDQALMPLAAGQLQMGMLSLHPVTLHNAQLTFEGILTNLTVILTANIAGYENMTLSFDSKPNGTTKQITTSVTTTSADDLLSLMTKLHDITIWDTSENNIASLMLTEGNLSGIFNTLQNIDADQFTLKIQGAPLNLAGKIIAIKNTDGGAQKHVISLDPAQRTQQ